ncbi:hypothetical protein fugu_014387 [Takifugu bimaculatus]|uniref:Uncharacterized protein n=1 Tax=Takifugu bimaculatus TaxID=433685 RepID=A0A4Z2C132_9TELE|nr:hypothetical protein fugu_014387 [Takifugu bimaculatus]
MMLPPPLGPSTICNLRQVFKPLPAQMWCFDDSRSALRSSCSHLTSEHLMWTFGRGRDMGGQRVQQEQGATNGGQDTAQMLPALPLCLRVRVRVRVPEERGRDLQGIVVTSGLSCYYGGQRFQS